MEEFLHIAGHVLEHSVADTLYIIPFLFVTYLAMEWLEHKTGGRAQAAIQRAGAAGPVVGAVVGAVPQCGFSAAAATLWAGRVITLGTLFAVFLSTSDEMLPIFLAEQVPLDVIVKIIGAKIVIGMVSGFAIEILFGWLARRKKAPKSFNHTDEECCHCAGGVLLDAVVHTLKVFFFVLVISLVIGFAIHFVGEDSLRAVFSNVPVLGEAAAGLVGLIPNCAASVIITQLYLDGIITAGPMMSGLLVSAGVGLLVLFKEKIGRAHV